MGPKLGHFSQNIFRSPGDRGVLKKPKINLFLFTTALKDSFRRPFLPWLISLDRGVIMVSHH